MTRSVSPIIIVGAGGFGREALDVVKACNESANGPFYDIVGVVDSRPSDLNLKRLAAAGINYLGTESDWLERDQAAHYLIGIGDPATRRIVSERFESAGHIAATVLHPSAVFGSLSSFGPGLVACAGVQVSTNVKIGRHVHLNPNSTIGHDSVLSDYVSVNPGGIVSGDVLCEKEVLIGAGAVVLQGVRVGEGSTVGAAACVTRDVGQRMIVRGIPAK